MTKKILFLVLLITGCLWVNEANAQWGFTATLTSSGNCGGHVPNIPLPKITGFSTKAECEAARAQVLNIKGSAGGCTVYYKCSACTGSDIGGTQTGGFTSTTISGPDQGAPNFTPNQARTVQDWMDDYMQKIQSMGFDNASMIALSGNKEFDRVYNDNALAYLGKSGSPVYKHPDQLKVNMGIQGTIPPKEDDGKRYMQIVGIERQILMALEERNQMERFIAEFCKTSSSNCEQYRKKIEDANKTIEDAQNMLRELNPEAREIDRITGEIERLKKRDSEMSWADKTEELAYEQLRRIDELEQQGIINSSTAEKMRQTAINDILAAKTVRATTDAYNEVKSFANEKIEIAKDLWENPGEYFADERVDKAVSHLGVDAVTIVGGLTGPVATVALGQYNEYAHQYIDNGAINHVDATKDHLKGIATDKALEYIPYGSHVATGKAAYGIIGGVWNVFKSVHEVGIERIQQK